MKHILTVFLLFIGEVYARPGLPNINFDTSDAIKQDKVNVIDLLVSKS